MEEHSPKRWQIFYHDKPKTVKQEKQKTKEFFTAIISKISGPVFDFNEPESNSNDPSKYISLLKIKKYATFLWNG